MIGYGNPPKTALRVTCTDGVFFDAEFMGDWQQIMSTLVQQGYISTNDVFVNRQSVARVQRLQVDAQGQIVAPEEKRPTASVRPLFPVVEGGKEANQAIPEGGIIEAKAKEMYEESWKDLPKDAAVSSWEWLGKQQRDHWLDAAVHALSKS
jgi:hypothetical protein